MLQERGLWIGLKKTMRPAEERKKHFGGHLFEETMDAYEACNADCCEVGKGCCARRTLEAEQDFATEKSLPETAILEAGHEVIFYPKSHCELNYIEQCWGALKKYTRENCKYVLIFGTRGSVLEAVDLVSLKTIRRF